MFSPASAPSDAQLSLLYTLPRWFYVCIGCGGSEFLVTGDNGPSSRGAFSSPGLLYSYRPAQPGSGEELPLYLWLTRFLIVVAHGLVGLIAVQRRWLNDRW